MQFEGKIIVIGYRSANGYNADFGKRIGSGTEVVYAVYVYAILDFSRFLNVVQHRAMSRRSRKKNGNWFHRPARLHFKARLVLVNLRVWIIRTCRGIRHF